MCLIAFAIGASPRHPLVIASNRDEFLDRPTLMLGQWQTGCGQEVISGRDMRAGGTWLGITPEGRVAFLTNVRETEAKTAELSRGELVTRWLESRSDVGAFADLLKNNSHRYGGFNLVLGDMQRNSWSWMTNRSLISASGWHFLTLPVGVYGLSNAALDTPWPKTVYLKKAMNESLRQEAIADLNDDSWQEPLWTALGNRTRFLIHGSARTAAYDVMENALSSAFVEFSEKGYGTRSSTVLVASRIVKPIQGKTLRISLLEKTYSHKSTCEVPFLSSLSLYV